MLRFSSSGLVRVAPPRLWHGAVVVAPRDVRPRTRRGAGGRGLFNPDCDLGRVRSRSARWAVLPDADPDPAATSRGQRPHRLSYRRGVNFI